MMEKNDMNRAQLHSAGATIIHESAYHHLISYSKNEELSQDFINKWVIPFYMKLNDLDEDCISKLKLLKDEITDEIILSNLGYFNWRTRAVGAYLSALKDKKEFVDIIGVHLLKSEVCYTGSEYAFALSVFNTKESIDYLKKYLDYYLLHDELHFDQEAVISVVKYLDIINITDVVGDYFDLWKAFKEKRNLETKNFIESIKSNDKLALDVKEMVISSAEKKLTFEISTELIEKRMNTLNKI